VVFVGVALEVAPVVWEYLLEKCDFRRGTIHSPDRPSRLKFTLELVGSALVALGVFGELLVGIKMAKVETQMRDATAHLVSLVDARAKDAGERAASADLARIQLEKSMMIRRLSPTQARTICAVVPSRLMNRVNVTSSSQDWEAFRYAQDFAEAVTKCLYAAGFGSKGFSGSLGVGNSFWSTNVTFGVWVRFPRHFTLDNPRSDDIVFNPTKRRALAERVVMP